MTRPILAAAMVLSLASCGGDGASGGGPSTPYGALLADYDDAVTPTWTRKQATAWATHAQVVPGDFSTPKAAVAAHRAWRAAATDPKWVQQVRTLERAPAGEVPPPTPLQAAGLDAIGKIARRYPSSDSRPHPGHRRQGRTAGPVPPPLASHLRWRAHAHRRGRAPLRGHHRHPRAQGAVEGTARAGVRPQAHLRRAPRPTERARPQGWVHEPHGHRGRPLRHDGGRDHGSAVVRRSGPSPACTRNSTRGRATSSASATTCSRPTSSPAHWLPAPLGADWSDLLEVPHESVDPALQNLGAKSMVKLVEAFYTAQGVPAFPDTFWENSSLFAPPPGARTGKTQGAYTWDIDLSGDVRVLMSARPSESWMAATYREFAFAHAALLREEAGLPSAVRQQPPGAMQGALGIWADLVRHAPQPAAGIGPHRRAARRDAGPAEGSPHPSCPSSSSGPAPWCRSNTRSTPRTWHPAR